MFHPPCFEVAREALPCLTLCQAGPTPGRPPWVGGSTQSGVASESICGTWRLRPSSFCSCPKTLVLRHVQLPVWGFSCGISRDWWKHLPFLPNRLEIFSLSVQSLPGYRSFVHGTARDKASPLRSALLPADSAMATGCGAPSFTGGRIIHDSVYFNHVKDS